MGINREEFEPWFGGFRNGTSCVLTASLASHASTSLIVSNNSSIFYTSLVDFHALFSCISLESLDIMIGINRLPHSTPPERKDVCLIYRREIEDTMDSLLGTVVILEFLPCVQR